VPPEKAAMRFENPAAYTAQGPAGIIPEDFFLPESAYNPQYAHTLANILSFKIALSRANAKAFGGRLPEGIFTQISGTPAGHFCAIPA
jgi:hypothetical protein